MGGANPFGLATPSSFPGPSSNGLQMPGGPSPAGSVGLQMPGGPAPGSVGLQMPRAQSSLLSSGGNVFGAGGLAAGNSFGGGATGLFGSSPFGLSPDHMGSDSLLARSASHAMQPMPFNFSAGPTGAESGMAPWQPPAALPPPPAAQAPAPAPVAAPPGHLESQPSWALQAEAAQAASVPAAVRGRAALLEKQQNVHCGVTQEPCGSSLQLDDCITRCRREVQQLAEQYRRRGQKYVDADFPADARALFVNGQSPSQLRPSQAMPASWGRASEGAFKQVESGTTSKWLLQRMTGKSSGEDLHQVFMPGPMGGTYLLSALAAMKTIGIDPRELIVWREPAAGLYGMRLFKDGEWIYEILDDFLPLDHHSQPACSRALCGGEIEDWLALVEKGYAKIHGSYEAIAIGSEGEALDDVLGMGSNQVNMREFPIWGELWQHLRSKRRRGYAMVATCNSSHDEPGRTLGSGLVSGFGYPVGRLEMLDSEMLVELENPWATGSWNGRWGNRSNEFRSASPHAARILEPAYEGSRNFWMSIQDFCKHFTDVAEARTVSPYWQNCAVTSSSDRPSHPLLSVSAPTQALFILSQSDRRWAHQGSYGNAIGLSVYRCRIVAPAKNAVGGKQNVSSPFKNLELMAKRALTAAHSVIVEVSKLEPSCLYIAVIESQYRSTGLRLRVFTASTPRFRELSAPETQYLLQAQATAPSAADHDSFSSQGSADNHGVMRAPSHYGHAAPYDHGYDHGQQGETDPNWHQWRQEDQQKDEVSLPRILQACMATCTANFRW